MADVSFSEISFWVSIYTTFINRNKISYFCQNDLNEITPTMSFLSGYFVKTVMRDWLYTKLKIFHFPRNNIPCKHPLASFLLQHRPSRHTTLLQSWYDVVRRPIDIETTCFYRGCTPRTGCYHMNEFYKRLCVVSSNKLDHVKQNKTMTKRWQYESVYFYQTSNFWNYVYVIFIYDIKPLKFKCVSTFLPALLCKKKFLGWLKQVFSRLSPKSGSYIGPWKDIIFVETESLHNIHNIWMAILKNNNEKNT